MQPETKLSAEVSMGQGPKGDAGGAEGLVPPSLPLAQGSAQRLKHREDGEQLERRPGSEQRPVPGTHSQGKNIFVVSIRGAHSV